MNLTKTPPTLPLDAGVNRCLAHGNRPCEWCERRYQCAAHETIKHDAGINAPAQYRKCWTETWQGFIPLDGFSDEDEQEAA